MEVNIPWRPKDWPVARTELLDQVKEDHGDLDVALAEEIYELGATAILEAVRIRNGLPAYCQEGRVFIRTSPVDQLELPGQKAAPAAIEIPMAYKKRDGYTGPGRVAFIPDDAGMIAGEGEKSD